MRSAFSWITTRLRLSLSTNGLNAKTASQERQPPNVSLPDVAGKSSGGVVRSANSRCCWFASAPIRINLGQD
ncbi:hypothetical protein MPL1032_20553 [Mesorhizobium plurifarium]|uniref:Uncharacterized protein n=1 Tax=Mesorhizobium plurifarium TaxID=69974 RepID=A0A0K2VY28_MESPL|nr:hypothetical protein MPL1032_20553 [Mesorhizobium plurifarium]